MYAALAQGSLDPARRLRRAVLVIVLALLAPRPALAQAIQAELVERVNIARWENGQLPPLKADALLGSLAQAHSQAMAERDFFMHCDPDTGLNPFQRMSQGGYAWNAAAENIAAGQSTAQAVMQAWMNSPGHRANILSTNVREIGVGYVHQPGDAANVRQATQGGCVPNVFASGPFFRYWTQKFGRRNDVYPVVIAREARATQRCDVDVYVYGAGFATQMRLSNDGQNWSAWQPYTADLIWDLHGRAGEQATVYAEIRNAANVVRSAQDTILLDVDCLTDRIYAHGFEAI